MFRGGRTGVQDNIRLADMVDPEEMELLSLTVEQEMGSEKLEWLIEKVKRDVDMGWEKL